MIVASLAALAAVQVSAERSSGRPADAAAGGAQVMLSGDVANRVIGPLRTSGPYRIVESSKNLRARGLLIHRIEGADLQRTGIRLRGDVDNVQIRGFQLSMRAQPQTQPHLPVGIDISSGSRITISDGVVQGFRMVRKRGEYTNGDGISAERKVQDLTIRNVNALDNSDGGFDLKSKGTRLDDLRAARNGRNYRFWGSVDAGTLISLDPDNAHVWAGNGAVIRIRRLIAQSNRPVPIVVVDGAERVLIESCQLRVPRGTPLVEGDGRDRVELGSGCRI